MKDRYRLGALISLLSAIVTLYVYITGNTSIEETKNEIKEIPKVIQPIDSTGQIVKVEPKAKNDSIFSFKIPNDSFDCLLKLANSTYSKSKKLAFAQQASSGRNTIVRVFDNSDCYTNEEKSFEEYAEKLSLSHIKIKKRKVWNNDNLEIIELYEN